MENSLYDEEGLFVEETIGDPLEPLDPPFPYFGGKRLVADEIWKRLGNVYNYIEPFCGSCSVLLRRPHPPTIESVNDKDGMISNFWRSARYYPEEVIRHADWPVNEADLVARHNWLVGYRDSMTRKLMEDPTWCDPEAAGWWVWGISAWIGRGYLEKPVRIRMPDINGSRYGQGIHQGRGEEVPSLIQSEEQLKNLGGRMPDLSGYYQGRGGHAQGGEEILRAAMHRMRRVRVACGEWDRILGPSVTAHERVHSVGIVFDPPYEDGIKVYSQNDRISAKVREWCKEYGTHPKMRIALCGYDGEHNELEAMGWRVFAWKANGGYSATGNGAGKVNATRERVWFSPHCLYEPESVLFENF